MKVLSTCLLAAAFLTFLSGCVTEVESRRSSLGEVKTKDYVKTSR
jgi:hypothetical protein